jgi:tetratricopeptide (TPR) repeat protein
LSSLDETLPPLEPEPDVGLATEDTMAARQPATDGGPGAPGRLALEPGHSVGRYVLLERVGAGGMGVVFAAYDPELDRRVAIKLLHPQAEGTRGQQRLLREARAMAKLSHPNVVAVHDAGELEGAVWVAMEFVIGDTLGGWLKERERSRADVVETLVAAGRGLAAAHAQGLIHRDFKPDNVMVGKDGRVRVMDFGLVRQAEDDPDGAAAPAPPVSGSSSAGDDDVSLTRTGALMGTPAYMAPEQHAGDSSDARTDQFSYCVTLYEALYGERPFMGDTLFSIMKAVTQNTRRDTPSGRDVPAWLRAVIDRGLATNPDDRWPSMDALLDALGRDPTRQRRRWMFGVGAAALLGAGLWGAAQSGSATATAPPCSGIDDALTEHWDDARGDGIAAAFAATEEAGAEQTWERVRPRLDAYADAWTEMRRDACLSAADGDRSQLLELRVICLERREHLFDEFLRMLETPDADLVRKAEDLVGRLPRLESCEDTEYLTAEVKPPEDPALAEQARALRRRVDDTIPLEWRGEYEQVITELRSIAADADAIDYRPLSAQLRFRLGVSLDYQGDYEGAREALESCFFDAQIAGSRLLSASCASKLVHVVGDHFGEQEAALMWARHAEAAIEGGQLDDQARGTLLNNRGNILLSMGRLDEALEAFESALELWRNALGPDHVDLGVPLGNIARVHAERGDHEKAIEAHLRVLALRIRHAGADHPHVADERRYLARAYRKAGRLDEAIEQLRLAMAGLDKRLGAHHPQTVDARAALGRTLVENGASEEGIALLRAALADARPGEATQHVTPEKIRAWLDEAGAEPAALDQ